MTLKTALTMVMMAVSLAACGRKSPPLPPADAYYPLHYPARQPDDAMIQVRDSQDPNAAAPPSTGTMDK